MSYSHGDRVVLNGREGTLHLPPAQGTIHHRGTVPVAVSVPAVTGGGYGVHTIRLDDGTLYRTEGRLTIPCPHDAGTEWEYDPETGETHHTCELCGETWTEEETD